MNLWSSIANSTMRFLLLLAITLVVISCNEAPLPDELPTQAPLETSVPTATQQQQPTIHSTPTTLPSIEFQGISVVNLGGIFGTLQHAEHQPAEPAEVGGIRAAQPERILFTFDGSELFESSELLIYPTAHYLTLADDASSHINQLKTIIQDRPVQPHSPLPLFPLPNEVQSFLAPPTYVNFEGGSGLSFITQVIHDSEQEQLFVFQGITDDGSYYVTGLFPVRTNKLVADTDGNAENVLAQVADRQYFLDPKFEKATSDLNDSLQSLKIQPQAGFPSPTPPAYLSYPGILLAYDPDISGEAVVEKIPPVFTAEDGTAVFLAGVPDAIQVTFNNTSHDRNAILQLQPIRGATKQFFPSIPAEQQQQVQLLEAQYAENDDLHESQNGKGFERLLTSRNGIGLRRAKQTGTSDSEEQPQLLSYQFQGVTDDGRYYVQFDHPIQLFGSLEEVLLNADSVNSADFLQLLAQLDQMIQSLIIAPDASTDTSIPVNPPDCTLDAQFVEDITIPDHATIERGENFTKTWRVRNSGTCTWTPAYQINLAGGNPISWSRPSVIGVVKAGEETEVSVEVVSPEIPGNYQAWWQLADEMGEPFGAFYHVLFEAPRPATDIPGHGVIEGELSYPSSGMPAMTIYFLRTDGSQRFALETEKGWDHYINELPVGEYYVFAIVTGDDSDSGGGYTAAAVCGLTCEDHTLVEVTIDEGKATREIDVVDWYAPAGTFPLP